MDLFGVNYWPIRRQLDYSYFRREVPGRKVNQCKFKKNQINKKQKQVRAKSDDDKDKETSTDI